jgi:hypothetical protein
VVLGSVVESDIVIASLFVQHLLGTQVNSVQNGVQVRVWE